MVLTRKDAPRPRHRWFAAAYDRVIEPSGRKRLDPLRRFAAGEAYGRVLELGAGNGSNLPYYDWSRIESLDLTEPDPFMKQYIWPRLESLEPDVRARVHVHEAAAERLPFEDDSFDCAVVTMVLCTVEDLGRSLSELRRVLKPGGQVRLLEHVRGGTGWSAAQKLVQPVYGRLSGGCRLDRDTENALLNAGFSVTVIERTHLSGPMIPALAMVATKPLEVVRHGMPARTLQRRRRLLKRGFYLLDRRFIRKPERYLLQATLAALVLAAVVAVEEALTNAAIITAIASSTFIIFMAPHSKMAKPRRVLGGHGLGIVIGLAACLLLDNVLAQAYDGRLTTDVTAAAAVGLSMLAMAATDTEHPPAAGTVLGIVLRPDPLVSSALIVGAALTLALARHLFRRWLIDLS